MIEKTQTHNDLLASLVDIRDVRIDRTLPMEERVKYYVEHVKNPYMFKVGNTVVRVSYADTNRIFASEYSTIMTDKKSAELRLFDGLDPK